MPNIDPSVLPIASLTQPGLIKPGTNMFIDGQGNLSAILAAASTSSPGVIKIDPTTLAIDANGILKVVATASAPASTCSRLWFHRLFITATRSSLHA